MLQKIDVPLYYWCLALPDGAAVALPDGAAVALPDGAAVALPDGAADSANSIALAGITFPAINCAAVVVTHRSTFPSSISLTKTEICFPLRGPTRSDGLMVPCTNKPFIGPVAPSVTARRTKTTLLGECPWPRV